MIVIRQGTIFQTVTILSITEGFALGYDRFA